MHHKRKRSTTRAEGKRIEAHGYRAAESRALEQMDRPPGTPRIDKWGYRPEALPLGDVACNGSKKSKRKTPKKQSSKCIEGHRHEWYPETVTEEIPYSRKKPGYWDCNKCQRATWYWNTCPEHTEKLVYTEVTKKKTCINCWRERIVHSEKEGYDPYDWIKKQHSRLKLKRRTLDTVRGW